MTVARMKFRKGSAAALVAAGLALLSLGGCVVYPGGYGGYRYGYAPAYYGPPIFGSVTIGGGWYGGRWR